MIDVEFEPLLLLFGEGFVHLFVVLLFKPEHFVLLLVELAFFSLFVELGVGLFELSDVIVVLEPALFSELFNKFFFDFFQPMLDFLFDLFLFSGIEQLIGFERFHEGLFFLLGLVEFLLKE